MKRHNPCDVIERKVCPQRGDRLIMEKSTLKIAIDTTGSITCHKKPKEARPSRDPVSRKIRAPITRAMRNFGGLGDCGGAKGLGA